MIANLSAEQPAKMTAKEKDRMFDKNGGSSWVKK
ncbi:hypothetical protein JOD01_002579 [Brevibacillus fulvus]|uniref:Uncharacterized protein n=1 Tax=Brevibacillus fulvus TaxID=1125967 RepID=A0A938Y3K3_9BACL|nr:hypothetical protein [Brevibacillus fulvus]